MNFNGNQPEAAMPAATSPCKEGQSPSSWENLNGERQAERHRRQTSDRQGHKTAVLLPVSFEDVRAQAENTIQPPRVQPHTLQQAMRNQGGSR